MSEREKDKKIDIEMLPFFSKGFNETKERMSKADALFLFTKIKKYRYGNPSLLHFVLLQSLYTPRVCLKIVCSLIKHDYENILL